MRHRHVPSARTGARDQQMNRALSPADPVGRARKCSKLGRQDLRHEHDLQRQRAQAHFRNESRLHGLAGAELSRFGTARLKSRRGAIEYRPWIQQLRQRTWLRPHGMECRAEERASCYASPRRLFLTQGNRSRSTDGPLFPPIFCPLNLDQTLQNSTQRHPYPA
jgi:hypothetical protein